VQHRRGIGRSNRARESNLTAVSLRGSPIETTATLPDGAQVQIRIGVPDDGYIARKELDTVDVELFMEGRHVAVVNTRADRGGNRAPGRRAALERAAGIEPA
jgi:hypothetical protein